MTEKQSMLRFLPYFVALSIGMNAFAAWFRSLLGPGGHSLAALVPADLGGAALAMGIVYLFMRRAFPAGPPGAPLSHRTAFAVIISGLAIVVTVTIISREWWLAVEMLVFVSVLAAALAYLRMGTGPGA